MTAIQHIGFNCRDVKAQEAFYTKHFGFRRARVFSAGTPGEFVMLRLGQTCLELFPTPSGGRQRPRCDNELGFKHLAFEVPDLDATLARLHADGIATDAVIDCSNLAPGFRICFFKDPDGNSIELMQGYQDDPVPGC